MRCEALVFFFQAEDGIRDDLVTGVQTCALPIYAWFAGFQPTLAAVSWIGYDTPRNLGSRETGGGLSLPIWIGFMQHALKGVPVAEMPVPPGVVNMGGEWYYEENARNGGGRRLGMDSASTAGAAGATPPPATEERNRILDLFRN